MNKSKKAGGYVRVTIYPPVNNFETIMRLSRRLVVMWSGSGCWSCVEKYVRALTEEKAQPRFTIERKSAILNDKRYKKRR